MLNSVRQLWQGWRERRLARAGLREDENPPAPADEPAPPASASGPAAETGVPGGGLAGRIKNHVRPGVLRRVDRLPSLRISRPRPPTYHIMPAEMQNVPHTPLPLARSGPPSAPAGEFGEGEAVSPQDTSAADAAAADDAAWDALWALRGTPSISAHPVRSTPVSPPGQSESPPAPTAPAAAPGVQRALPQAETRLVETRSAATRPVATRSAATRSAATRQDAPTVQRALPEVATRSVETPPPAQRMSQDAPPPVSAMPAPLEEAGELPPPMLPAMAISRTAAHVFPQPSDMERAQTARPEPTVASLLVEHPEPDVQSAPVSPESTALAGQKAVQPDAPLSGQPVVARRKADLAARPVARRVLAASPAVTAAFSAQGQARSQGQARPPERTRLPERTQPPDQVPISGPAARTSLRALLSRLSGPRRPAATKEPTVQQAQTLHVEPPVAARPVPQWPQLQDTGPAPSPAARPTPGRPQPPPPSPKARAAAATPSEETPPASIPTAASTRPIARRLVDSVPPSVTAAGPAPIPHLARAIPRTAFERGVQDAAVSGLPAVEVAPVETRPMAPFERTKSPGSSPVLQAGAQDRPGGDAVGAPPTGPFIGPPAAGPSRPIPSAVSPIAPAASPVAPAVSGTHTIQRTIRDAQDLAQVFQPSLAPAVVQTAPDVLTQAAEAAPAAGDDAGEQAVGQAQDLEAISRQVYQIIRRRMAVERERERGR